MVYQRVERVKAKIFLIVEEERNKSLINFTTPDGITRFANFSTETTELNQILHDAFNKNVWITLVLARVNSENDWVQRTEAVELPIR